MTCIVAVPLGLYMVNHNRLRESERIKSGRGGVAQVFAAVKVPKQYPLVLGW